MAYSRLTDSLKKSLWLTLVGQLLVTRLRQSKQEGYDFNRRRKFPPKPRLLTNEEYYEQGARETKHALENLRKYCSSPDCAQWSIMLKLNDPKRFASFVEGNSHLSDDEIVDYEAYAFSMERKRKPASTASCTSTSNNLEISDDDSSVDDEEL